MNRLKSVVMILAAPLSGDGKNRDNSNLDLEVLIITNTNHEYLAKLGLRKNFEVERGFWVPALMNLPDHYENITYENFQSIDPTVIYWKPDYDPGNDLPPKGEINKKTDKWNIRIEVVLTFDSGDVLSTDGSDPAIELNFKQEPQTVKPFRQIVTRQMMINHQGFKAEYQGQVD